MKRILIGTVLGCTMAMAAGAGVAAAAGPLVVVDTAYDVEATATATPRDAISACVDDVTTGTKTDDETAAATSALNQPERCSLRMAIIAATAIYPYNNSSIKIVFHSNLKYKTIPPYATQGTGADVYTPPLPPIYGDITIDGCGAPGMPQGSGPCVNLILPSADRGLATRGTANVPGLVVAGDGLYSGDGVVIRGLAFLAEQEGVTAIAALPGSTKVTIENSYFGLTTGGTVPDESANQDPPDVGIQLSGNSATIGGTKATQRNVFATGETGVLIQGGDHNKILGNRFGVDAAGNRLDSDFAGTEGTTGVKITSYGYDLGSATSGIPADVQRALAGAGYDPYSYSYSSNAQNNEVGGVLSGDQAATPACDGPCNLFGELDQAIDVGGEAPAATASARVDLTDQNLAGASDTKIQGNQIGTLIGGQKAGANNAGIVVRNGSRRTLIGGGPADGVKAGNLISYNGGAGVSIAKDAGRETVFAYNAGQSNAEILLDLGEPGPGNKEGASGGAQAPAIAAASTTSVSGTAAPNAEVHVYLVPQPARGQTAGSEIESYLGAATASGEGGWTATVSAPAGRLVTATATAPVPASGDRLSGTSELAANALIPPPPKLVTSSPPAPKPAPRPAPAVSRAAEPAPSSDRSAPTPTRVLGRQARAGRVTKVPARELKVLSGELSDPSGVKKVRVALQLLSKSSKARVKARARRSAARRRSAKRCTFVDLTRIKFVRRPCSRPPFVVADGAESWRVTIGRKATRLFRSGQRYLLLIRATDTLGNTGTTRLVIRIA